MNVNPTIGIYKCFACGAAGDVFKFVQEHEKMDFKGAVEWVANFTGFALPKLDSKENTEEQEERGMVRRLNELACQWFEQQLTLSEKAQAYLNSRHITEETRKRFHIGYAPAGREGFIGFAVKNGFSPADCVKAGLAKEKENGGISDKFRDRLMIAIQNQSGVIVAFGGRDLSDNKDPNFKPVKYMNSPESATYHKSDILFGLYHSRRSIAEENAVIIVEGYFDMISLFQGGVTNVVAASGTALTETHANILARYAKTAYLVFDGDAAGQNATLRSLEIVLPKGIAPKVFALSRPDGTKIDPDNFVNEQGADAFKQALTQAEDWLSYLARQRNLQSPETRADFVNYTKSLVKSIADRELQNQYLKLISERFNTDRSLTQVKALKPERKKPAIPENGTVAVEPAATIPWHAISPIEIRFANLLLRTPTLMNYAVVYFDMEWATSGIQMFESPIVDEFVNSIIALYSETGYVSPQLLYENVSPEIQVFIEGLPDEKWSDLQAVKEFYQTLTVLSSKVCDRQKKLIPLDSQDGVNIRMQMLKFVEGIDKLSVMLNTGKIDINIFIDQVNKSKSRLIMFQAAIPGASQGTAFGEGMYASYSQPYSAQTSSAPASMIPASPMPASQKPAMQNSFAQEQNMDIPEMPPEMMEVPPESMEDGFISDGSEIPPSDEEPPDEEAYSYDDGGFNDGDDMGF